MTVRNPNDRDEDDVLDPLLQPTTTEDSAVTISGGSESTTTTQNGPKYSVAATTANVIRYIKGRHHNKRYDAARIRVDCSTFVSQSVKKKKTVMGILAVLIVLFYTYSSIGAWSPAEQIPVIHHSHVPGMKELKSYAPSSHQQIMAIDDKSYAPPAAAAGRVVTPPSPSHAAAAAAITTRNSTISKLSTTPASVANLNHTNSSTTNILLPPGYLVWSDNCKIQNIEPYSPDVMQYFKREKYDACSNQRPLTHVKFNETMQKYMLVVDESLKGHFTKTGGQLDCCYEAIERSGEGKKADKDVKLSKCLSVSKSISFIPPTTDNIIIKCKSRKQETYVNAHAMMPERPEIRARLDAWKLNSTTGKPMSVLMMGIDSISRVNLIRAMPKTAQYLYDNEWFEMAGYNKMDDNTFPNLMAILTGFNSSTAFTQCDPTKVGALDACPFMWKTFREHGYVTAYAEDEASISTFNYLKVGFEKPPVDYYMRPLLLQAEKSLHIKKKTGLTYCLGYQHEADYVYDYALELATRYKDDPYFGLFWANTFSHNAISDCSSMDEKVVDYLKKFSDRGVLDRSIVVFFSDHGMRFGPTRKLPSGHLEERLPFMFIWLPPWVKETHPEFVNALSVNKNRLTNPYDLHMTLKHVLELSGRSSHLPPSQDCPNCQTLLRPVPHNRSCEEISIEDHWCTCMPYSSIHKSSAIVRKVAKFTVSYINEYVHTFKNGSVENLCAQLHLGSVHAAYRSLISNGGREPQETYRVTIVTKPNDALFEATVRYSPVSSSMRVTGQISRLDTYLHDSRCIADGGAKKYCSCK